MKTKNIPTRNDFNVSKLKVLKGAVEFDSKITEVVGHDSFIQNHNVKNPMEPHPALTEALQKLKTPLGTLCGLLDFLPVVSHKDFMANGAQKALAEKHHQEKLERIKVTGFTLKGEGVARSVVITGTYINQSINTPLIRLESQKHGFEAEVYEVITEALEELYKYAFEGKRPQTEMDFSGPAIDGTGEQFEKETGSKPKKRPAKRKPVPASE